MALRWTSSDQLNLYLLHLVTFLGQRLQKQKYQASETPTMTIIPATNSQQSLLQQLNLY